MMSATSSTAIAEAPGSLSRGRHTGFPVPESVYFAFASGRFKYDCASCNAQCAADTCTSCELERSYNAKLICAPRSSGLWNGQMPKLPTSECATVHQRVSS